jgi:cytochrome c oxidase assembly factor CtaG
VLHCPLLLQTVVTQGLPLTHIVKSGTMIHLFTTAVCCWSAIVSNTRSIEAITIASKNGIVSSFYCLPQQNWAVFICSNEIVILLSLLNTNSNRKFRDALRLIQHQYILFIHFLISSFILLYE